MVGEMPLRVHYAAHGVRVHTAIGRDHNRDILADGGRALEGGMAGMSVQRR